MSQSRQLAAIMFTDIVGYTAMMGKDTTKALELLRRSRIIQKPIVEKYQGQWLKEMGDGVLMKFGTASGAVNCAIEIQRASGTDFDGAFRIGIHLGDITIENDDVFGDGVNVAFRLESIADPGGIYISESIEKAIRGQSEVQAKYLGELELKNVDYGVRTYALQGVGLPIPGVDKNKKLRGRFWAEINRRGVLRAAFTYIVTSLLLILILVEAQNWVILPSWSMTTLLVCLIVGFPIAVSLAWHYERSPEGFVRTKSQQSWQNPYSISQKKPMTNNYVVVGMILVVLVLYVIPRLLTQKNLSNETISTDIFAKKSIAVIPFVDMSPEGDHEWLSDGISEELLNALIKLPDLKVIGRTSSWRYKGIDDKDLKTIGHELGVETILEGSVRRAGTRIRVTAQLVNTKDGFSLWSQSFDRELVDIFAIQEEITASIIKAMEIHLIDKIDTQQSISANIETYTKYLKARQTLATRSIENLIEAKRLFEESIRLDPNYDPAYSGLARAVSLFPTYSLKYSANDVIKPAKEAAKKALELNPQNSEAYSVIGYVATYHEWDWASAEIAFKRSVEISNSDAEIYNFIGDYYQVVMHPLAIEMETKALELDPLNYTSHFDLSRAYALFDDWENALRYSKSAQSLRSSPGLRTDNMMIMLTSYIKLGRIDEAENLIAKIDDRNDDYYTEDYFSNLELNALLAIAKNERDVALSQIEQMIKESKWPRNAKYGRLFLSLGEPEKAAYWFEKAIENHDWGLISHPITNGLIIPENLPPNPVLQQTLDVPELNALFEIRRKNLVMSQ